MTPRGMGEPSKISPVDAVFFWNGDGKTYVRIANSGLCMWFEAHDSGNSLITDHERGQALEDLFQTTARAEVKAFFENLTEQAKAAGIQP